jgi:hypothetical protein
MARGRMISNSLSTSEKFAQLSAKELGEFCQALYPLIVAHSDDFGRLQGDPFTVKAKCYPASPRSLEQFKDALTHLDSVGLVVWYVVEGKRYLQIVNFERHQIGLHKRTRSMFPRVPGITGNIEELPDQEKGTQENLTQGNGNSNELFAQFWAVYPKKIGKDAALRAWRKCQPDRALATAMIAAVETHRRSAQWRKDDGQFIPNPATWLNQGRWQDELAEARSRTVDRPPPPWVCPHDPVCTHPRKCQQLIDIAAEKARAS